MKINPTILVDRREQRAWHFENLPSKLASLTTGDYSLQHLAHLVSVERKSLDDLVSCVGTHRDRFKRELQRLKAYRFRVLIIESSYADLEAGQWRSQLKPSHVLGSLSAWQCQFSLPVMLVGSMKPALGFARNSCIRPRGASHRKTRRSVATQRWRDPELRRRQ